MEQACKKLASYFTFLYYSLNLNITCQLSYYSAEFEQTITATLVRNRTSNLRRMMA